MLLTAPLPALRGVRSAFLGVERSVCGRAWRDRLDERATARALSMTQRHGVSELLGRILAARDVEVDGVEEFLDPTVKRLMPDPDTLTDMPKAAARIADAIVTAEKIAIFGDYDVDGAASAAVLAKFLRHCGNEPLIHIPDRLFEGYGPNTEAVRALATVADVVPLKGLNRAFVCKGLLAMRRREHVGLTALMDAARLTGPPECWHLGFLLGPRINAGGRIGRADLGVRLLLEQDATQAGALAAELDRLNRERQVIEQATLAEAEAEAMAALGIEEKGAVVVTAGQGWHPGVVGLVAARLKERYGRPAFAIALEPGGIGTGSGRSITDVDLGSAVRHAVATGLLVKGGGHAMAAGVTIAPDKLAAFRAYLEETLAEAVEKARHEDCLEIDGALTAAGATVAMLNDIARAGPFGAGHAEPVFALPSHAIAYAEEVGQAHVRARLRAGDGTMLNAIAFRAAGKPLGNALIANRGRSVHAAGTLSIDRWNGEERVQLRLMDLAPVEQVTR